MEDKKVVHVPTQEMWDFVTKELQHKWKGGRWNLDDEGSCINLNIATRGPIEYFEKCNYQILTFDEFCKEKGIENPFEKKEIQFEVGKWYNASCNSNLYQFDGYLTDSLFGSSAVINPLGIRHGNIEPGYHKIASHNNYKGYFFPSSLANMDVVNKFLPKEKKAVSSSLPIEGEYYRVEDTGYSSPYWMIGKVTVSEYGSDSVNKRGKAITINSNKIYSKEGVWCYEAPNRTFRPATEEEKQWLDACIDAEKYMSKEDALFKLTDDLPEIPCESCNGEGRVMEGKLYPTGHHEVWETCSECGGEGFIEEEEPKEMTKDELLAEAHRKYPAGTRYKSAYDGKPDGISNGKFEFAVANESITPEGETENSSKRFVYYEGKWAEIISLPENNDSLTKNELLEEAKKRYPIGTQYKPLDFNGNIIHTDEVILSKRHNLLSRGIEVGVGYVYLFDKPGIWAEVVNTKKESFVLPEKWCVRGGNKEVNRGFSKLVGSDVYLNTASDWLMHYPSPKQSGRLNPTAMDGYTEITFDQFKEHVLKESRKPEQMSDSELLAEANRRYPIGTKYSEGLLKRNQEVQGPLNIFTTVTSPKYRYITDGYGGSVFGKDGWSNIISVPNRRVKKKNWEHLTKEARSMYPVGSVFYDLVHKVPFEIASHDFNSFGDTNQIYVSVKPRPGFNNKTARLYKDGEWAKKIEVTPRYIAGIDPYREPDDRITAMAMVMQSQQNDLRSMLGIPASRMERAGPRYNGLQQIFADPDDFKWDVIVPQELKSKSITTKLNTHVDTSELRLPEVKQKSKTIKF